jgi:hypothetical protein
VLKDHARVGDLEREMIAWLKSQKVTTFICHAVLVIALLSVVEFLRDQYGFAYARNVAHTALNAIVTEERGQICPQSSLLYPRSRSESQRPGPISQNSPIQVAERALLPGLGTLTATDEEKMRIADQALKAQRLQCMHADLFARYVGNYYMAILVSIFCGAIAAVAVVFMGTKGWANANPYVVNIFVTMAAVGAFFGSFVAIFEQPMMATAHKKQVLRYEVLIDGMASYTSAHVAPSDCTTVSATSCSSVADLIHYNDAFFASQDIPFEMDLSKSADYGAVFHQAASPR